MENEKFNEILKKSLKKKSLPNGFYKMKRRLGEKKYNTLSIISGTLLSDAVIFMKEIGVLEEFLENKNEISQWFINIVLENRLRLKKNQGEKYVEK